MGRHHEYESHDDFPPLLVPARLLMPRLRAAASWTRVVRSEGAHSTMALVRVCTNDQAWVPWDANFGGWRVVLVRPRQGGPGGKIARSWHATAQYVYGEGASPVGPVVQLGAGTCGSWPEAIRDLAAHGAWHCLLETCLPFGRQGRGWALLTPVVVRYPYADANEPNARYTSFSFTETGIGRSVEDAAAVMVWGADGTEGVHRGAIARAITRLGANAYVEREHSQRSGAPSSVLHLWHRRGMLDFDEITETDFTARVLAGID